MLKDKIFNTCDEASDQRHKYIKVYIDTSGMAHDTRSVAFEMNEGGNWVWISKKDAWRMVDYMINKLEETRE